MKPCGNDARVVDHGQVSLELFGQLGERPVSGDAGAAVEDEQPGGVAPIGWSLGDELRRQLVVEVGGSHPASRVALRPMDEQALERARKRIGEARTEGVSGARLDAALERARAEVMRLAKVADELEGSLPKQVSTAVRDGVAREVLPVSRSLAEIRGGLNQALRRLERLEQELLAERNSRIEDLAILVDLVSSGWSGVDQRLRTLEAGIAGAVVPLRAEREETVLPDSAADAA